MKVIIDSIFFPWCTKINDHDYFKKRIQAEHWKDYSGKVKFCCRVPSLSDNQFEHSRSQLPLAIIQVRLGLIRLSSYKLGEQPSQLVDDERPTYQFGLTANSLLF